MRKHLNFSLMLSTGVLLLSTLSLASCGEAAFSSAQVRVSQVSLELKVGESKQLTVSVSPKNAISAELRWFSSNENVAYVNDSGVVFGVGEGTATITAAIGGGFASCKVTVQGEGGGGEDEPYVYLSPSTKKIKEGTSFELVANVYPASTTVTFTVTSGADRISVTPNGNSASVLGVKEGVATINATGSNGKIASCSVEVTKDGGDDALDHGVEKNLGYSGAFTIGATPGQENFIRGLVDEFNAYTGSSISATVLTWSEDKAADLIGTDPTVGPHIYPYASDQTLRLNQRNALSRLDMPEIEWIEEKMGETALDYATLAGANVTVGYPFTGDNGYVMFYDKSAVNASQISNLDDILDKANELDREFAYPLTDGFYAAGALMSYTQGKSLYKITVTNTGSFTARGSFNGDQGYKAAQTMSKLFSRVGDGFFDGKEIPSATTGVLATIADCSNVQQYKEAMGANYGVAPLPYISETDQTRLGVFLGYKFYGLNPQRIGSDANVKAASTALARFICSDYAQAKRYQQFSVKPTVINEDVLELCKNEPHIAALNEQIASVGTIPLTAVDSGFWDATMTAAKSIKTAAASGDSSEATLKGILADLDTQCRK